MYPIKEPVFLSLCENVNESYGMGTNGILAGIVFGVILTVGIFVVIRRYSEKEEKLYESGFIIQGRGFFDYR